MSRHQRERIKPGAILRAAGAGGKAAMPEFAGSAGAPTRDDKAARLVVERDGGRVARIIAYCRCGEKIAIDCDYEVRDEAAAAAGGPPRED